MTRSIWLYGKMVGTVEGNGSAATFAYHPDYRGPILSASLPMDGDTRPISPWLSNLLPDNENSLAEYALVLGGNPNDPVDLCSRIGFDLPGAVEVYTGIERPVIDHRSVNLTESEIEAELAGAAKHRQDYSISGFQHKIALRREGDDTSGRWMLPGGGLPTTHILKPAMGIIGAEQARLEGFSQRVAELSGFDVPQTRIVRFGSTEAVVSTRYDRMLSTADNTDISRVHQEDLCQMMGLPPQEKYSLKRDYMLRNALKTGNVINRLAGVVPGGEREMLRRLALQQAMLAGDGHLKNFSILIHENGEIDLAPLYDLNSFIITDTANGQATRLAIPINDKIAPKIITIDDWKRQGEAVGVPAEETQEIIQDLFHRVPDAISEAARDPEFDSDLVRSTATALHREHLGRFSEMNLAGPRSASGSTVPSTDDSEVVVVAAHERGGRVGREHTRRRPRRC